MFESALLAGLKYGLIGSAAVGTFAVGIAALLPVVVLAYVAVGAILSVGGNKNG